MRLFLKDSERRPDPEPVKTDDRKAVMVGLVIWVLALATVTLVGGMLFPDSRDLLLWTCVAGISLGLLGLVYTNRRHS